MWSIVDNYTKTMSNSTMMLISTSKLEVER